MARLIALALVGFGFVQTQKVFADTATKVGQQLILNGNVGGPTQEIFHLLEHLCVNVPSRCTKIPNGYSIGRNLAETTFFKSGSAVSFEYRQTTFDKFSITGGNLVLESETASLLMSLISESGLADIAYYHRPNLRALVTTRSLLCVATADGTPDSCRITGF
jgi:hypothetical protein